MTIGHNKQASHLSRLNRAIIRYFVPPIPLLPDDGTHSIVDKAQEYVLDSINRFVAVLGTSAFIFTQFGARDDLPIPIRMAYFLSVLFSWNHVLNPYVSKRAKVIVSATVTYILAVLDAYNYGFDGTPLMLFVFSTVFALILGGIRLGAWFVVLSTMTILLMGWLMVEGVLVTALTLSDQAMADVFIIVTVYLITVGFISIALRAIFNYTDQLWSLERKTAMDLATHSQALQTSLERESALSGAVQTSLQHERDLSEFRSRIITNISHEFRTPLTVISSSSNLLDQFYERLDDQRRSEQFERIDRSIDRLIKLLEATLQIERQQDDVLTPVVCVYVFNDLCESIKTYLEESFGEGVMVDYDTAACHQVGTDEKLIKRICHQLVENALKFGSDVAEASFAFRDNYFHIVVADNGIGIPIEERNKTLELFHRGSNAETFNGLGIGLFLVKQAVDALNGVITIESNDANNGIGTRFEISFPNPSDIDYKVLDAFQAGQIQLEGSSK